MQNTIPEDILKIQKKELMKKIEKNDELVASEYMQSKWIGQAW